MSLSKTEEELMGHLWRLKSAFMKDLINCYKPPRPAPSTIATLLKRMQQKGFVQYTQKGKSRLYEPRISKNEYFGKQLSQIIGKFFNGSKTQFASFFTAEADLNEKELKALRDIIDQQIKDQ